MKRIKVALTTLMLVALTIATKAQDLNWQARAGIGQTCLRGSVSNINERTGFHIGGGADIGLSKNGVFRLQPELRFERKGWQFDGYYGNEQIMTANFKTNLDYIELPVLAAARLRLGKKCYFTYKTGPYFAYGLNAKTRMKVLNTDSKETFSQNHFSKTCNFNDIAYDKDKHNTAYPKFDRWDIGVIGGIDLTFDRFIIGGEVSIGLKHLCDPGFIGSTLGNIITYIFTDGGPKNMTANISVAYQF